MMIHKRVPVNIFTYLDHVDRLDDASSEHTRGTAINEGLDSSPDTNWSFLLFRHLFVRTQTQPEGRDSAEKKREKEIHLVERRR